MPNPLKKAGEAIRSPFSGLNRSLEQTPPSQGRSSSRKSGDKQYTYYDSKGRAKQGVKPGTGGQYTGKKRRKERLGMIQAEAKDKMARLSKSFGGGSKSKEVSNPPGKGKKAK
jgi:hypothetical protein